MTVYFSYRSFQLGPTGKYLKVFDDTTILDWFRHYWDQVAQDDRSDADDQLTNLLGCDGWFLWNPFVSGVDPPATDAELLQLIAETGAEHSSLESPCCLQVFTEEDGEGGALFYFDDAFLSQAGGRAAYLLHTDWRLPEGVGSGGFQPSVALEEWTPAGTGPGTTYIVWLQRYSKYPLEDFPYAGRIEGVRVPQLAALLCQPIQASDCTWPATLLQLRPLLLSPPPGLKPIERSFLESIQADRLDRAAWAAWADWREEHDAEPVGVSLLRNALEQLARMPGSLQAKLPRELDLSAARESLRTWETYSEGRMRTNLFSGIQAGTHLVQACLDVSYTDEPYFAQVYVFDDLWASAHPDLASSLLRFATRWDVLSPD